MRPDTVVRVEMHWRVYCAAMVPMFFSLMWGHWWPGLFFFLVVLAHGHCIDLIRRSLNEERLSDLAALSLAIGELRQTTAKARARSRVLLRGEARKSWARASHPTWVMLYGQREADLMLRNEMILADVLVGE